jgi:hypothetical protein
VTEPTEQAVECAHRKSRLAVVSLIFGILTLPTLGLLSIPCIICGHLAHRRIKKGFVSGKRLAIAGLIMGYVGIFLFVASVYWSSTRPAYTPYTLPSGKTIKIMAFQKWIEAGEDNSLVLRYQTDIDLNSKDELRKEVEHIWQFLRINVEKEGMTKARILAQTPATGRFVKKRSGFGFLIEKQVDGTWQFRDTSN